MADADGKSLTDEELVINHIEALARLETELAEAAECLASADDPTGRQGARNALAAIHRFLCAAQVPYASRGPVIKLFGALAALDQGNVLPIVEPAPVGRGNRPVTAAEWLPRALAAAALELRYLELKKQGTEKPLDEAATWVARETSDWPDLTSSGDIEERRDVERKRIKKWRSEMMERPQDDPVVILFKYLTAEERNSTAKELLDTEPAVWGIKTQKSQ